MQAAASSVSFVTASHVLASAGMDEQLMLLDRRSNSVAASVGVNRPLHSLACKDDGTTLAVGTSGDARAKFDSQQMSNFYATGLLMYAASSRHCGVTCEGRFAANAKQRKTCMNT